ncbi:MAG: ATPase domain-containing protein [Ferrimicrobium sp.]|uniref:ATPase domain-containing protein n=1 Tax=Ferrimicrobium acidiphilum TaxID=121039 RepID=A0ABV3Y2A2_9ACTN|nr:ATPase domain-containing protein [Ferrimicrobium sp.]MCL5973996.1 AAA family ATPase [Actinomycetota bacterium]
MRQKFRCNGCGERHLSWMGQCSSCGEWGLIAEESEPDRTGRAMAKPVPLASVTQQEERRLASGIAGLDELLGAGFVFGSVVLVSGEPGVGKSSLILGMSATIMETTPSLYISAEETQAQLAQRARRFAGSYERLLVLSTRDSEEALAAIESTEARFIVIDSLQALAIGVTMMKEFVDAVVKLAKLRELVVVVIGQVTKDGDLLGPRYVEHMVDASVMLEATGAPGIRRVMVRKNRFGPSDGVRRFSLDASGVRLLEETNRLEGTPEVGRAWAGVRIGRVARIVEVNALVGAKVKGRLLSRGVETDRVRYLLSVIDKHCGLDLAEREVMVAIPSGSVVADPRIDLAIAIALVSSRRSTPMARPLLACAEIGLLGELIPDDAVRGLTQVLPVAASEVITPTTRPYLRDVLDALGLHKSDRLKVVGL